MMREKGITRPLFSIIMPTYNSTEFVQKAVQSVVEQTFEDWELFIVDDCSTDGTLDIVRRIASDNSKIVVEQSKTNMGPAMARNRGIELSRGRYIAFIDSDDLWRVDKLEKQYALFLQTRTPLAFSAYEKIDEAGNSIGRIVRVPDSITYRELLGATVIATVTAAYDSEMLGKVFMPNFRKRQDFGLWLKILRGGGVAQSLDESLAYLRKRPGSVSSNKVLAAWYVWRVYRELECLSVADSAYNFSKYAYRAFFKSLI